MYPTLFDCHIHSENSPDGHPAVDVICRRALQLGFSGLAITDHVECQGYKGIDYRPRILKSTSDAARAEEQFQGSLTVIRGLELGQPLQDKALALEMLGLHDYDFVIGSLHGLGGAKKEDFVYWDAMNPITDLDQKMTDYYDQLIDLAHWGHFDVMGHITYPVRYAWGIHHIPVDFTRYSDRIDQLLRILIENGRGIEINTSGLRQGVGMTMPHLDLIRRYRQLGGEIITIGSDAHFAEHVGLGVAESMELLRQAGFGYFTYYKERKPHFVPVD